MNIEIVVTGSNVLRLTDVKSASHFGSLFCLKKLTYLQYMTISSFLVCHEIEKEHKRYSNGNHYIHFEITEKIHAINITHNE